MIIKKFEDEESWMDERRNKITGSRLGSIVVKRGTGEKKGYYELIAERLAKPKSEENAMDRGHRLEVTGVELLEKELDKTFIKDLVIWEREDNDNIAISPDAYLEDETEAVEVKCLNSAEHIEALINNEFPKQYYFQVLQYFIVNDKLQKLYFVMYDDRLMFKQFHFFIITRDELETDIIEYLEYERKKLEEINKIVNQLSF